MGNSKLWFYVIICLILAGCATTPPLTLNDRAQNSYYAKLYPQAIGLWEEASESTDKETAKLANFKLGYHYSLGEIVPKNTPKAMGYYEKAAALGSSTALYNMALKHLYGRGVARSPSEAILDFEKSAGLGDDDAAYMLGRIYHNPSIRSRGNYTSLQPDYAKAIKWYKKTLELNKDHKKASAKIGSLYLKGGNGIKQDVRLGLDILGVEAGKYNYYAMNVLGKTYRDGSDGVKADTALAFAWYWKAYTKNTASHDTDVKEFSLEKAQELDPEKAQRLLTALEDKNRLAEMQRSKEEQLATAERKRQQLATESNQSNNGNGSFLVDMLALAGTMQAQKDGNVAGMQAMAQLSNDMGSGSISNQINTMAQTQTTLNQREAQKEQAAQAQRESKEAARQEAKLKREIEALKKEQKQLAQAQRIQAINQQTQLANLSKAQAQASQTQLQQQQAQAEQQRKIKAQQALAQKQKQERLRQQQLAQASQQQTSSPSNTTRVTYNNCIQTADRYAQVRDTVAGSEAYIRNYCGGEIKYRVCVKDSTSEFSFSSPGSMGTLRANEGRWVYLPNLKAATTSAGFAWCGPSNNCQPPSCR